MPQQWAAASLPGSPSVRPLVPGSARTAAAMRQAITTARRRSCILEYDLQATPNPSAHRHTCRDEGRWSSPAAMRSRSGGTQASSTDSSLHDRGLSQRKESAPCLLTTVQQLNCFGPLHTPGLPVVIGSQGSCTRAPRVPCRAGCPPPLEFPFLMFWSRADICRCFPRSCPRRVTPRNLQRQTFRGEGRPSRADSQRTMASRAIDKRHIWSSDNTKKKGQLSSSSSSGLPSSSYRGVLV
jgi:hypothetical protein